MLRQTPKTLFLLIGLALFVLFSARAAAADPACTLPSTSVVTEARVVLADLLGECASKEMAGKAGEVLVCRAPALGTTKELSGEIVTRKLAQAGLEDANLKVPELIRISRKGETLTADEIRTAVMEYVSARIPFKNRRTEIRIISRLTDLEVPAGKRRILVSSSSKNGAIGRMSLRVEVKVNDKAVKIQWINVKVAAFGTVYRASRNIKRYQRIGELDLVSSQEDLSELPRSVILDRDAIVGQRARAFIPAKGVFTSKMVEVPPLVKKGDIVTIVARSENLIVRTVGQVKQDGTADQMVRVLNLESKKTVFARIVDKHTVMIDFGG